MSWKSAIEQKKRYILSAVLLYCNMQSWSVGSGSCTVSTTGIVTVIFSHEKKNKLETTPYTLLKTNNHTIS